MSGSETLFKKLGRRGAWPYPWRSRNHRQLSPPSLWPRVQKRLLDLVPEGAGSWGTPRTAGPAGAGQAQVSLHVGCWGHPVFQAGIEPGAVTGCPEVQVCPCAAFSTEVFVCPALSPPLHLVSCPLGRGPGSLLPMIPHERWLCRGHSCPLTGGRVSFQVYYCRSLALAFLELTVVRRFHEHTHQPSVPPPLRAVLRRLSALYGLWSLSQHTALLYRGEPPGAPAAPPFPPQPPRDQAPSALSRTLLSWEA